MFLRVMQWSNHCVPWQINFVGVLFGLRPLLCVWFVVSLDETQVWPGDLRVVWLVCGCFLFGVICPHFWTSLVLVQNVILLLMFMSGPSPSATSATLEEKKIDMEKPFFRPTPSWLSPGRYTRSTAADKLNCNCLQGRQLGQQPQKSW